MGDCNFEKDLEQLEQIVSALEEGGLSLDDSLKQFELGIKLARRCEKTLSEAEKKIEVLTKKAGGELVAEPFEETAEHAARTDGKAKAPKVKVEETTVAEKTVETVARKRSVEVAPESEEETEDDEDSGAMLF